MQLRIQNCVHLHARGVRFELATGHRFSLGGFPLLSSVHSGISNILLVHTPRASHIHYRPSLAIDTLISRHRQILGSGYCSRRNDWLRCGGRRFGVRAPIVSSSVNSSRRPDQPTQLTIPEEPVALSMEIKRSGREADHSPPTSAEVKIRLIYTSTPPIRLLGSVRILCGMDRKLLAARYPRTHIPCPFIY
jgi:hypothetical protein